MVSTEGVHDIPAVGIQATYSGAAMTVLFNSRYLCEFLEIVGSEQIALTCKNAGSVGEFFPLNDDEYVVRYFVMPMKPDVPQGRVEGDNPA